MSKMKSLADINCNTTNNIVWKDFSFQQAINANEEFLKALPVNVHHGQFKKDPLIEVQRRFKEMDSAVALHGFSIGQVSWQGSTYSLDLQYLFTIDNRLITGPIVFAFFNALLPDLFSSRDRTYIRLEYSKQIAKRFSKISERVLAVPLSRLDINTVNDEQEKPLSEELKANVAKDSGHQLLVQTFGSATFFNIKLAKRFHPFVLYHTVDEPDLSTMVAIVELRANFFFELKIKGLLQEYDWEEKEYKFNQVIADTFKCGELYTI